MTYCVAQGTVFSLLKPILKKDLKRNLYMYIYITESLCCAPETEMTL